MIKHARLESNIIQNDGDIDAKIVQIDDTGDAGAPVDERYQHTIYHQLGRKPIGCFILWKDAACDVYVVDSDDTKIVVKFTAAHVKCRLEIR